MVAGVLPVGLFGIVVGNDAYAREINEALEFNDAIAATTASVVDVAVESARELVEGSAREPGLLAALSTASVDTAVLNRSLEFLRDSSPLADAAWVIDSEGAVLAISPREGLANTTGKNYSSRDYFQGAFACGCTYVSGAYRGTVVSAPHGAVATAVPVANRTFLLGIALSTSEIDRRIGEVELPHESWVVITDQYGVVLDHPVSSLVMDMKDLSGEEWVEAVANAAEVRLTDSRSFDGAPAVISAVRCTVSRWLVAVITPTVALSNEASAVVTPILGQTAFAAIIAAAMGLFLARRITRPVIELAEAAREVERGGSMKMDADGSKEMDYLKKSIEAMARTLTERIKENQDLVHELERDQQIREQMLDIVSHELRTPVTVIQGYGELLSTESARISPERREAAIGAMRRASLSLGYLIQSMVVISRLRSGRERIHPERFGLEDALKEAAILSQMHHPRQAQEPQIVVEPPDLEMRADRQKALMVFHNLLDNATKFGGGKTPVHVRAFEEGGEVVVVIRDEGPGFPKAVLERLGIPFVTGDPTSTRMEGGLGLGLMVAKTLTELHGGRLTVDSRPGEGSTVFVRFPRDMRQGS